MERIPRVVGGLSLVAIVKPNVSEVTCYCTPRALSTRVWSKSKSLTDSARSDSGTDSMTLRLFDSHLVSWKPPHFKSCDSSLDRWIASSSEPTDFKQSST